MRSKAEEAHAQPTDLHVQIRAMGEFSQRGRPGRAHMAAARRIGADADGATDMVQHDPRVGKRIRKVAEFRELRVVHPGIEGETERGQLREAFTEPSIEQDHRRWRRERPARGFVRVPCRDETHAAEAPLAGDNLSLERRPDGGTGSEVGRPHDGGRHAWPAERLGAPRGGDNELGLAKRAEKRVAIGAVMGVALDEDAGADIVPAGSVGAEIVEQVWLVRRAPKVVVSVNDRQPGLQRGFMPQRQPLRANGRVLGGRVPGGRVQLGPPLRVPSLSTLGI